MNELQQLEEHKTFLLNSIQQFSREISDGQIVAEYAIETNRETVTAANAHRIEQYSQMLQRVEAKINEKCKK